MQLHFNSTYIDVLPTDESYRYRSIMGEHTLNLYFSLSTYTDIPTGAWCEFQGERYTLNQPAKVVKHNSRHFEYTITMESEGANLKNYKFRNPNDKTLKFPFTASPRYHIQILVDCLNMIDSGWQVGTTIEANEKLISYNHNNCLEALDMIAKAFETEYEIIGKTIHLHKVEYFKNNPLPLQYGKGKGFKTGVSRTTEQSRITRLYVQGGERNIDRSKYGNKELLLPKSQEYVYEGVTFVSDDKGLSIAIKNAQNNGFINEQSLDLSHIYPSRKGTASAVFEVDKAKHFYDFADTSIPQALNFADLQIKGEKMVIYFESGMLSGREFEISRYEHSSGYNHSARRFEIVPKEEDGTTMPNDIFKPAVGDRYSVYNMHLPAAYICDNDTKTGASWEMMKEACKYLYENRADLFTFTGDLDGIWAKKNWANVGGRLKMGAYIHFSDNEFQRTPVAIRIVGLKEYVNNPYSPQIELSNKVQGHSFSSEIRKLQNQEVYFGEMNKKAISETKRSWRNALETIKQVEEAFPEYTKSIIPATVQTMMALVGNKAGQFAFVANKTNPITVPHTLYFDRNNKQINAGSGWIKHYTLGTTDIKPNHSAADYKYWYVSSFVSGRLDDKAKTYYLYIKASKTAETAQFVLSENKIGMEQEAGFYHFLYATVNSEYDGERGIAQFNGFTEITGGQLVTNKISSGNGEQYILLLDNEIIIKANLRITDGNKTEIKQLVNPDLLSLESRLKQYGNQQVQSEKQAREQSISIAKTATENYARTQSELTKAQAIAEANRQAGIALTAEQQARILQLQQNLQQAKTFAEQKVNELDIGGRNLLRDSGRKITNKEYLIASYPITINLKEEEVVTLTLKGRLGVGKNYFQLYNSGGNVAIASLENKGDGIYQKTFKWKVGSSRNNTLFIFTIFNNVIVDSTIEWIKLERGNKPTDWSPAPEDIENKVADIQTDLQVAINNARALIAVETQNRQRTDTNVSKLVNKTNFLSDTYTAGNAIATGTIILGNSLGVQAGITGVGAANNDIRFWAGSNYTGRNKAPFMVKQDGTLYATKANISGEINATSGSFTGQINATSGKIGGFTINSDYIGKKYGFYDTHDDQGCYIDIGGMCVWKRQYSQEYKMKVLEFTTYGYYFIGFWVYPAGKNTPIKHRIIYRDSNKDQEYIYPSH
nr:MAG TPA: tail protein [Caudoviricetes sp.]DAN54202.1 MAG TPA: tail protein [Caudoviricetes sp.]